MAVVETGVATVNITINDTDIAVPKGELIVESVKRLGLEIPIFCYHPRMKPVGMCRMCLVEVGFKQPDGSVRKMPKPQAGCTLPASEGMVVYTDSEMVHRDRKGVLEFLLINHPLDCPICDRGGECPLQNNTLFYGPSTSRFVELKRHAPKAFPLSSYVTLDLERCIQCGRCVRFTEEISGDAELAFRFRGGAMQPSTFELRNFESKFSGNVIEICPVGALTSSKYRFRARPWDLQTKPGICTLCSNGCNVWMDYRVGKMVRVNGRIHEGINEEWTCDKGKFGHDFYNTDDRLTVPLVRDGERLVETEWAQAYNAVLRAFTNAKADGAALAGPMLSNEDGFLLGKLFRETFGSTSVDHRFEKNLGELPSVNQPIASFENEKTILVFGTSLADELPILFLRVRKAWFMNGARVIVAHDKATDVDSFAQIILRYSAGSEAALAAGLRGLLAGEGTVAAVANETGVSPAALQEAVNLLKEGAGIITTRGLANASKGLDAAAALNALPGRFSCYARGANEQGLAMVGVTPGTAGRDTHAILKACAEGSVKALWLAGVDPFAAHPDRALVEAALENVEFLVVQDHSKNEAVPYASVVLPMAAPAEAEGTYTNLESRVQRLAPVLTVKGQAKPAWRIYAELTLRVKPGKPFFNAGEVMDALAAEVPTFAPATYAKLGSDGVILG